MFKLLLAASVMMVAPLSYAQDAPAPAPPPAPVVRAPRVPPVPPLPRDDRDHEHGERGYMHGPGDMHGPDGDMSPPGTWWRNPDVAARIGLTADQQKRIDDIFLQSRVQLIHLHASLEEAQLLLEPLMDANPVDQPKALAQIGKIADTRAELEKTNAKMLLGIRAVLNADQWTKLREEHPGPPHDHGQRGPGWPGGPQGPPPPR